MRIIGIDPGLSGAVALVEIAADEAPRLLSVWDMPTYERLVGKKVRRRIDCHRLLEMLRGAKADLIVFEELSPILEAGAVGAMQYGRSFGNVECAAWATGARVEPINPKKWKKEVGIPAKAEKDQSRMNAMQRFPAERHLFVRQKDDGRADAALIAVAGARCHAGASQSNADAAELVARLGVPV